MSLFLWYMNYYVIYTKHFRSVFYTMCNTSFYRMKVVNIQGDKGVSGQKFWVKLSKDGFLVQDSSEPLQCYSVISSSWKGAQNKVLFSNVCNGAFFFLTKWSHLLPKTIWTILLYSKMTISPGGIIYFHLFAKEKWIETLSCSGFLKCAIKDNLTLIGNGPVLKLFLLQNHFRFGKLFCLQGYDEMKVAVEALYYQTCWEQQLGNDVLPQTHFWEAFVIERSEVKESKSIILLPCWCIQVFLCTVYILSELQIYL